MIYRIKLEVGYKEICFDFKDSCQAIEFLKRGTLNYNLELSDSSKFLMTMCVWSDEEDF